MPEADVVEFGLKSVNYHGRRLLDMCRHKSVLAICTLSMNACISIHDINAKIDTWCCTKEYAQMDD